MTVSTSSNNVVYRGNGATTQFAVPFKVLDEDHLVVTRRDYVTGVLDYTYVGTDYSFTGVGDSSGTLTLAGTALDDDFELVIERIVPYTQDLDIVNAGGFYPETVEEQLDLITMGVQQLAGLAERGAFVPVGESGLELSNASDRAGKFFGFDVGGNFVALSGTGNDADLRNDLVDNGPQFLGYAPPGATTSRGLDEHLDNAAKVKVYVEDYKYNGVTLRTDKERLLAAHVDWLTLGGSLHYEAHKEYDLGSYAAPASIITIFNPRDGATIEGNGATIKTNTTANQYYNVLYIFNYRKLTIRNLHYTDTGYLTRVGLGNVGTAGGKFIVVDNDGVSENNGLTIDNCSATEALSFFSCQGDYPANRTQNVLIKPNCRADDVFYVINAQNNGDGIKGGITASNPGRAYFPYGVTDHDLDIKIFHDGVAEGATSMCLIKRYARNTSNIRLRLTVSGSMGKHTTLVTCEHSNTDGAASRIDGVDLEINVASGTLDPTPSRRLHFSSLDSDAFPFVFNTGNVAHVTTNVRLRGNLGQSSVAHVKADYTATSPCLIDMSGAIFGHSLVQTVDAPGFLIRTGPNDYFAEKYSAGAAGLNAATIAIPIANLQLKRAAFRIVTYAEDISTNTAGAASKMHIFDDFIGIYAAAGVANVGLVTGTPDRREKAFNTSDLTLTWSGGTDQIIGTFASAADYRTTTAFARMEIQAIARPIMR